MSNQYTLNSIAHYEAVFGQDFVSPGGKEMATELIRSMDLNPGARVLDVGCGLGGCAFVMARDFGLFVEGIDLSSDMIDQACSRCHEYGLEKQVSLHVANCLDYRPEQLFDAVFSRDVFLHIADKTRLFDSLFSFLKPGGKLLFTDYCCGPRPWSDEFSDYVNERGYTLHTTDEYVTHIAEAGFDNTQGKDASSRFLEIL